jgi:hypothetical protein
VYLIVYIIFYYLKFLKDMLILTSYTQLNISTLNFDNEMHTIHIE